MSRKSSGITLQLAAAAAVAAGLSDVEDLLRVRQTSAQPLLGLEGLIGWAVLGEVVVPAEGSTVVDVLQGEQLPDENQPLLYRNSHRMHWQILKIVHKGKSNQIIVLLKMHKLCLTT